MNRSIKSLLLVVASLLMMGTQAQAQQHGSRMSAEERQQHMEAMVAALDMTEAQTQQFQEVHMTHMKAAQEVREAELTAEARRTRMQALRQDQFLAPGSIIEANRLMAAIDDNPNLRGELQALAGLGKGPGGDGTLRGNLERLLKKLRDDGYLVLANPEREIYEVTGKIEYLQEVVDFLMAHQSIPDEVEEETDAEARQDTLL